MIKNQSGDPYNSSSLAYWKVGSITERIPTLMFYRDNLIEQDAEHV